MVKFNTLKPKLIIGFIIISTIGASFYVHNLDKELKELSSYLDYMIDRIESSNIDSERRVKTVYIYNDHVQEYNTLIHSTPNNILNNIFLKHQERKPIVLQKQINPE